jgi:hypothetical protein
VLLGHAADPAVALDAHGVSAPSVAGIVGRGRADRLNGMDQKT